MKVHDEEHDVQSHIFRPAITDMQGKHLGGCYDMYLSQSQYTKVAAFGHQHKRGSGAFGRANSFVASFALALNKVNIVAVTTILVLQCGNGWAVRACVIGHHVPRHIFSDLFNIIKSSSDAVDGLPSAD